MDAKRCSSYLPPGFRFHPTDEELIIHYLKNQAMSRPCPVSIIPEVDIYKFDPWQLPGSFYVPFLFNSYIFIILIFKSVTSFFWLNFLKSVTTKKWMINTFFLRFLLVYSCILYFVVLLK